MSHKAVEAIIGKLVTDEAFRRRFFAEPGAALDELRLRGYEVTPVETEALLAIDATALHALSEAIDTRLQKLDLRCP